MVKFFSKRKNYVVEIISNKEMNETLFVEAIAKTKKEAKAMVTEVLIKSDIFRFESEKEFFLNCRKEKKFKSYEMQNKYR